PEQTRANSTAWSLKKSTTLPFHSQSRHRTASAGQSLSHKRESVSDRKGCSPGCLFRGRSGGLRVGELHVRDPLLEVAGEIGRNGVRQRRDERPQGVDRQLRLLQVAALLPQVPVPERRDREDGLDEDVRDLQLLELGLQLPEQLLLGGLLLLRLALRL